MSTQQLRVIVFGCLVTAALAVFFLRGYPKLRHAATDVAGAASSAGTSPPRGPVLDLERQPTHETIESDLDAVREAIRAKAISTLPPELSSSVRDLAQASEDWFRAMIFPDFDRFEQFRLAHGYKRSKPATAADRQLFLDLSADAFLSPFSLSNADIRIVVRDGVDVAHAETGVVSRSITTVSPPYAGPQNVAKQRATVVEVRIPIRRKCVESGRTLDVRVGYRFVWDQESKRWYPQSVVQYLLQPGAVVVAPM